MDAITELNYKIARISNRLCSEIQDKPEPKFWQAHVDEKDEHAAYITYMLQGWPHRLNEPIRFTDLTDLERQLRLHSLLPPGEIHPVRPPENVAHDIWNFVKEKFGIER